MINFFSHIKQLVLVCMLLICSVNSYSQISEADINNATDIINGIGELLKEDTPDAATVAATNKAYADAAETARKNKELAEWVFKRDYLDKYMENAQKGNGLARMELVYGLYNTQKGYCHCNLSYLVPDWQSWMKEAIKEKSFNAINLIGFNAIYPYYGFNLELTPSQGLQIMESVADSDAPLPGYLGSGLKTITAAFALEKNIDSIPGAYVNLVVPKSAAEEAGLLAGDVIIKQQDKAVNNAGELLKVISNLKSGAVMKLTLLRNGQEMTLTATLKNRPGVASRTDTRIVLGDFYNMRKVLKGGEDAGRAFAYYTGAAADGSPNAMYNLGKIYLYGITGDKAYYVRHKVERDETAAFNWFMKSIENTRYAESMFQKNTQCGSHFVDDAYKELIQMYKKGTGCEKSEAKANELAKALDNLLLERKLDN